MPDQRSLGMIVFSIVSNSPDKAHDALDLASNRHLGRMQGIGCVYFELQASLHSFAACRPVLTQHDARIEDEGTSGLVGHEKIHDEQLLCADDKALWEQRMVVAEFIRC